MFISSGELGSDRVDRCTPPILGNFKFRRKAKLRDIASHVYEFEISAEKNTSWVLRDSRGITLHPEYQGERWIV